MFHVIADPAEPHRREATRVVSMCGDPANGDAMSPLPLIPLGSLPANDNGAAPVTGSAEVAPSRMKVSQLITDAPENFRSSV